jgi:hypothetical protein
MVREIALSTHEQKYFWKSSAQTVSYDNPFIVALSNIPQGDGDYQRVGDACRIRRLRGSIATSPGGGNDYWARLLIVQWRGSNATPTLGNFLPPNGGTSDASTVLTQYNHDDRSQYTVLYDTGPHMVMGNTATNGTSYHHHNWNINVQALSYRVKDLMPRIQFVGGSTNTYFGGFWLIALSSASNASGVAPLMSFSCVADFVDD